MAGRLSQTTLTQNPFSFKEQFLPLNCEFTIRNHVSCLHFLPQGQASTLRTASPPSTFGSMKNGDQGLLLDQMISKVNEVVGAEYLLASPQKPCLEATSKATPESNVHVGAVFAPLLEINLDLGGQNQSRASGHPQGTSDSHCSHRGHPQKSWQHSPPPFPASTCLTRPLSPYQAAYRRTGEQPSTKGVSVRTCEPASMHPSPGGRSTRCTLHSYSEGDFWTTRGAHPSRQLDTAHFFAFSSLLCFPGTCPGLLSAGCTGEAGIRRESRGEEGMWFIHLKPVWMILSERNRSNLILKLPCGVTSAPRALGRLFSFSASVFSMFFSSLIFKHPKARDGALDHFGGSTSLPHCRAPSSEVYSMSATCQCLRFSPGHPTSAH